ncbi:MAG TPA: universal stress protein [Alloacidobacterium sp.]|nr:universal stress protein [Alloacidobacterium sp.]
MTTTPAFRFHTIVVATDLSDASLAALHYAQSVARMHGSRVVITHVVDPVAYAYPSRAPKDIGQDQTALNELRQIEDEAAGHQIPVHSQVESNIICDRILQSVEDNHADLLVLGTKAKTGIGRAALGVVARHLLARTPCPMLLVSPGCETHLPTVGCWRRVLIATDFSLASLEALGYAHHVAYERLMVVHAESDRESYTRESSLERLRFLAPFDVSHTVPVEHVVTTGEPGRVIAEHANKFHADLVVLGSPDYELEEADLCSSTVLQVVSKVNCPVLCVPSTLKTPAHELMIHEVLHAC